MSLPTVRPLDMISVFACLSEYPTRSGIATICGFTEDKSFQEQAFYKHITAILKAENYRDTSFKVFSDLKKYTERLEQLLELETDECNTKGIMNTLKSVAL
jgi:hypothetical protein